MKKFVSRLLQFFILISFIYGLAIGSVVILNKLAVKNCRLQENVSSIILGDSHTMWSINDAELPGIQNISLNAEGYIYTYAKLLNVLKTEPNVSQIYLGMSYHNLAGYYDEYIYGGILRHFIHRYIGVMSLNDFAKILMYNPKNILNLSVKILQNGSEVIFSDYCELYGSFPEEIMTETLNREQMNKRIRSQFYSNDKVVSISEVNLQYLNKIIELCKNEGLQVTILSTPLHNEYKKLIPQEYINLYDQFISENNLTVYDFNELSLPDSCFLPDADHVNYYGALETTKNFKAYHEQKKPDLGTNISKAEGVQSLSQ